MFFQQHFQQQFQQQQQSSSNIQRHFKVIIMAGGEGKRMKSNIPKVLCHYLGRPMLHHIVEKVLELSPEKVYIITGKNTHQSIIQSFQSQIPVIQFVKQENSLGTGNAIQTCLSYLHPNDYVLILNGDMPAIRSETLARFVNKCDDAGMITTNLENPFGYGRILRNENRNQSFVGIREEKDCNDIEREIHEVNSGIYYFQSMILKTYIPRITNDNSQQEYYLTDIFKKINESEDLEYYIFNIPECQQKEVMGVNTKEELERLESL